MDILALKLKKKNPQILRLQLILWYHSCGSILHPYFRIETLSSLLLGGILIWVPFQEVPLDKEKCPTQDHVSHQRQITSSDWNPWAMKVSLLSLKTGPYRCASSAPEALRDQLRSLLHTHCSWTSPSCQFFFPRSSPLTNTVLESTPRKSPIC